METPDNLKPYNFQTIESILKRNVTKTIPLYGRNFQTIESILKPLSRGGLGIHYS